jgi:hypothetical protein
MAAVLKPAVALRLYEMGSGESNDYSTLSFTLKNAIKWANGA